ncbi:MAG: tyrosine-type recombinase/integrase [Smithella sp.]|jgi:integrase|nr:tyrosine-type recombinase/integrase [Smithella sp.]
MDILFKSVLSQEMYEYLDLLRSAKKDTESYVSTFRSLDEYMVKSKVNEKSLTDGLVREWLKTLSTAETTKNCIIARIRVFSRYLTALSIPACEPDFCRASSAHVTYTFTDEEFASIITVADNFKASYTKTETAHIFPILLRVLYGCGLRVGEALALRWENIDSDAGIITILEAKNNRQRRVPISDSLTDLLQQYRDRRFPDGNGSDFLFANFENAGKPYLTVTFWYWFGKVIEKAGIRNKRNEPFERCISPHTLRHYFTFKSFQKAVAEGRVLEECAPYLSAYLGHESFYGTEKYLTSDYTMYTDSQERTAKAIQFVFPEVVFE